MRSVLSSTTDKNYWQLAQAFKLTCLQRFGVARAAEICKDDKLADRSDAIAQLFQDELEAANAVAEVQHGPMSVLRDERQVQEWPGKMAWLFEPYLQDLYERRLWKDIERFESASVGARLVGALVLATARTGELVSASEASRVEAFHTDHRKWLVSHLLGSTCDADCRGRLVDVMLSSYGEAQGDYDEPLKRLLLQPRGEAGPTLAHLHARLLWCQVDSDDLAEFRDRVLVPAVTQALSSAPGKNAPVVDPSSVDDLVGLTALVPEPTDPKAQVAWKALTTAMAAPAGGGAKGATGAERYQRVFATKRAAATRERQNPPPMIKKVSFCNVADASANAPNLDQ
jgi:hypothetical protein